MPYQSAYQADGRLWHRSLLTGDRVEQVQFADPVIIAQIRDPLAIPRLLELVDIPGKIRRHDLHLLGRQVDVSKALELRVLVSCNVNALSVLAESRTAIGHLNFGFPRRQLGLFAGLCIHHPEIGFVDGNSFH